MNKRFAITMGDPCGIGPEIIIKALMERPHYIDRCLVFGSASMAEYYARQLQCPYPVHVVPGAQKTAPGAINVLDPHPVEVEEVPIGKVSALGGECAFRYVRAAIDCALAQEVSSVVTAPLNKESLHLAGHAYAGHTEIFGEFTHGDNYAMLLWSKQLKAIHVSTHISLRDACTSLTKERIVNVIHLAHQTLKKTGYETPRIAVAGLNPHAGENGLFGDEEIKEIIPAVEICKEQGMDVTGPIAPDTVFLRTYKGEFDIVVAQYHDQGHIPLKLLAFDEGVNITVGLDVVRTSVDHGTAFDIAGKLLAKPDSLLYAIEIGEKL
jgi:4-hydroxythreonine-4-phosphate dehydrogenase